MGNIWPRSNTVARRVIWCDTEGGVRGIPVWDITLIDEAPHEPPRALRLFSVKDAHKAGRSKLRKCMPISAYMSALKTGMVYGSEYVLCEDGTWSRDKCAPINGCLAAAVKAYLTPRKGCVLCAWNMRAHDKFVLRGLVGKECIDAMVLWDALPWFRSRYSLPKNSLSSDKPGTPRHVFTVQKQGEAHTSLADTAHLRELVLRAAFCLPSRNTKAHIGASRKDMFEAVQNEIEREVDDASWVPVSASAWDEIPVSVKTLT